MEEGEDNKNRVEGNRERQSPIMMQSSVLVWVRGRVRVPRHTGAKMFDSVLRCTVCVQNVCHRACVRASALTGEHMCALRGWTGDRLLTRRARFVQPYNMVMSAGEEKAHQ